jgi:hypothetical protein
MVDQFDLMIPVLIDPGGLALRGERHWHTFEAEHSCPDGQHVRFGQRWSNGQHLAVPASHSCNDPQQLMLPPLPQTVPEQQAPPRQLSVEVGQQFPLHCLPLAQQLKLLVQKLPTGLAQHFVPQHWPFVAVVQASPVALGALDVSTPLWQAGPEQSPGVGSAGASASSGPSAMPPIPSHRVAMQSPGLLLSPALKPAGCGFEVHTPDSHTLSE